MKNRKEEIIQATLVLAAEKGLGTISLQQIADKVGITKASLYNHFSSKDEIVEAMYEVLRNASKEKGNVGQIDYDHLTADIPLKDILMGAVGAYRSMVSDPQLYLFYKIIMSERSINQTAAELMVRETQTMIHATQTLFYALQVKKIAAFPDVDAAAFSFAMAIHAILDYEFDLSFSGTGADEAPKKDMIMEYINEFCRVYGAKKKGENQ